MREVVDVMHRVKEATGVRVTTFFTRWGYEVARIFGVVPMIRMISSGGYYEEILVGDDGMYFIGRLNRGRYKVLVIAPATSNSIAKFVNGIADSIASALFSQALKSGVPIIVFPTDMPSRDGFIESEIPCYIDRGVCMAHRCRECPVLSACPVKAVKIVDGAPRIDLRFCIGCEKCVSSCPYGAARCWEKVYLRPSEIDLANIEKLKSIKNVYVVSTASELYNTIVGVLNM